MAGADTWAQAQNTRYRSQLLTHTVVSQLGLLTTPGRDADGTGGGTAKTRTEKNSADVDEINENHDEFFVCCPPPFMNALTLCTSAR